MQPNNDNGDVRLAIENALQVRKLRATPQAINTLICAATASSPELAGDSDSLLLGLIYSGSYTVDLLRDAGADIDNLTADAGWTAQNYHTTVSGDELDPVSTLFGEQGNFGQLLVREEFKQRPIEASDLLQEALSPRIDELGWRYGLIPPIKAAMKHQSLRVSEGIQLVTADALDNCCREIWKNPTRSLANRCHPLTEREIDTLRTVEYFDDTDIQCVVRAVNGFLLNRELPTNDREFVALAIEFSNPTIGSSHFTAGGGNYSDLSLSLGVSSRFAPERDEPVLGLIELDGRIHAQYFSYRGTGFIEGNNGVSPLSVNAQIQLPLIPQFILQEFEALINNPRAGELDIQRFLERNPEILKSLGYAECQSHVILQEPGRRDLIPDFLLHRPGNNGFDILDLKLPTATIARNNPYPRISQNITKALGQLRAYKNYFQKPLNRDRFIKQYGIEYFEPKLIVAIGRQSDYPAASFRDEIQNQAPEMRILTYDEVIAYASTRAFRASQQ